MDARDEARQQLGWSGRMISYSKSGYRGAYPERMPIFNANVCGEQGKLWHGDLDLTLDETKLQSLAASLGEPVFVLYEQDGRFATEARPRLSEAFFCAFPGGTVLFDRRIMRRAADGRLLRVPARPPAPPHLVTPFDWDGKRRPRLLRFWRIEHVRRRQGRFERTHLIYVGARKSKRDSPLLVLGLFRAANPCEWMFELTFYPSSRPHLSRGNPQRHRRISFGPLQLAVFVDRWPRFMHELRIVLAVKEAR
jgi:hypothetical protein